MSGEAKTRTRKAWRVFVEDYDESEIVFSENASKAKAKVWRSFCTPPEWGHMRALRARDHDVFLPARDPECDQMSDQEIHCLKHTFGVNDYEPEKAGYRNYFFTSRDDETLNSLVERGMMKRSGGWKTGDKEIYFFGTDRGHHVAMSLAPEYAR